MRSGPDSHRPHESCEACGFDSDLYSRADATSSTSVVPRVLAAAVEGLGAAVVLQRPDASTWSMGEYIDHVRESLFANRFVIEVAVEDPGTDLGDPPQPNFADEPKQLDVEEALKAVEAEAQALRYRLDGLGDGDWSHSVQLEGELRSVGWFARHAIHDALHHLGDIGRIRHRLGHGAATERGTVAQISVSDGGVPKRPIGHARVGPSGVDGDAQGDRRHHGRPVQAVCLWSADVIRSLQEEGHPIEPGLAGENITVSGVTWAALRPGTRLTVGDVPILISAHAVPCAKNAAWFRDRDFNRMLHQDHPGWSRLYGIPLASGDISVGANVVVEPA